MSAPPNGGVLYANGKTTFLVIDESGTDTTYTSYTGIANVPNIEWKGGTYTAPITLLTEDNTIAKTVIVAKTKVSGETNNSLSPTAEGCHLHQGRFRRRQSYTARISATTMV